MSPTTPLRMAVAAAILATACATAARNVGQRMPVAPSLATARASDDIGDIEFGFGSGSASAHGVPTPAAAAK